MTRHANKLYILNHNHYWHLCLLNSDNQEIFTNKYKVENNYFICSSNKDCKFKFPTILGPTKYYENPIKIYNGKTVYSMGPPYAVYWCHLEQFEKGYIELDISAFL